MTSLYNGWTPPVKPLSPRDLAIDRLCRVADHMTDEEYQVWFDDAIHAGMSFEEIQYTAEAWFTGDDCDCNPRHCTCKPVNQEIPY